MYNLRDKIENRDARVGVIGLGYVGLPLAVGIAEAGFDVYGFDRSESRLDMIRRGESYIGDVSSDRLKATNVGAALMPEGLPFVDVVCVCVPTPITKAHQPDLTFVESVMEDVGQHCKPGTLVILESTTYPGTTRDVVEPILTAHGNGERLFYIAYSPEMADPGNPDFGLVNTPKIVGGLTEIATELAVLFYSQVVEKVIKVSSPEVAEMAKVFSNVFRLVNIALVDEMALLCERMGLSVWDVIDAVSEKPFGFMKFTPGPGVGGHCIPLDPYYLVAKAAEVGFHPRFIETAADITENMPHHVVDGIDRALDQRGKTLMGAEVGVLGVAYKPNVADYRESPALEVIKLLRQRGAGVWYHDPLVPSLPELEMESEERMVNLADCIVFLTAHDSFNVHNIIGQARLIYDATGVTRVLAPEYTKNVVRLGE